jgi:PTH2 family peptidyl-tRNA hydrolase
MPAGRTAKLTIVVRADLGMSAGKVAAQAAHAAVAAALANRRRRAFRDWTRAGQPKVVLQAGSAAELDEVVAHARSAGLPVQVVCDAGRTQVPAGTPTCCAVGPAPDDQVDAVTGDLRLY